LETSVWQTAYPAASKSLNHEAAQPHRPADSVLDSRRVRTARNAARVVLRTPVRIRLRVPGGGGHSLVAQAARLLLAVDHHHRRHHRRAGVLPYRGIA